MEPPGCEYQIQMWNVCVKKNWVIRTVMDGINNCLVYTNEGNALKLFAMNITKLFLFFFAMYL